MRKLTEVAQCAKLVRQELKRLHPEVKFSVRSENYSMGDSVDVYYSNVLTDKEVKELREYLKSKYQYGSFNGMDDIYEYTNKDSNIPQTKYLFLQSRSF